MRITDQQAARLTVLMAIRRTEPVARTELARATGMPLWSVSEIVADLIALNLLVEEKSTAIGRGRPRIQLRINPDAALVLGAFVSNEEVALSMEILNLRGDTLFSRTVPLRVGGSLEALGNLIADGLEETLEASPFNASQIDRIGLGLPGLLNSERGLAIWTPAYEPGPVPLADVIRQRLDTPVFLDSTGNILTRAEHWFGVHREVDDFAFVFLGRGISFGQYSDGQLRTGDHGTTPVLAHTKVKLGGRLCHCGARGCLQAYATCAGLIEQMAERDGVAVSSLRSDWAASFGTFADEARRGEPVARAAFNFAGEALGVTLANYINLWAPARVLVVTEMASLHELTRDSFQAAVDASVLPAFRDAVTVEFRTVPQVSYAKGAAAMVLEQLYRGETSRSSRRAIEVKR